MRDFTRLGTAVPPLQYELMAESQVATPHVGGVAAALADAYAHPPTPEAGGFFQCALSA